MDKTKLLDAISRMTLIAGMVVLGVFAVMGAVKIIPAAVSSLASVETSLRSSLSSSKNTITLSLSNNSITTGESTTVSFEKKYTSDQGTYMFKFDCDNKNLTMTVIDGSNQTRLLCNTSTKLTSNPFTLVPNLEDKNTFVDSNIYVEFIDTHNKTLQRGQTVLTVRDGSSQRYTTTTPPIIAPTSSSAVATSSTPQNYATTTHPIIKKADLYLSMKGAGIVTNNVYVPKAAFTSYESPSVRFDIGNDGNISTGPWQFTAILPTNPGQVFSSGIQPSLAPGEIIEYTLTLANLASSNNLISVNVDITNTINELSETNNIGTLTLRKI